MDNSIPFLHQAHEDELYECNSGGGQDLLPMRRSLDLRKEDFEDVRSAGFGEDSRDNRCEHIGGKYGCSGAAT